MGQRESILCSELPSLLRAYEEKHDIIILDLPDFDNVVKQSESHPDLALDPENLFQFLSICTQLGRSAPPSPPLTGRQLPHSASLPPTSFRQHMDKTPRPRTHNRRLSDRIRSPSDSSSSDEDRGHSTFRPRAGRQQSAPPIPFNTSRSSSNIPGLDQQPLPPLPAGHRARTRTDSGGKESPLAQRVRAGGKGKPPSSFAFGGATSFARPSPASRRRRGSTSGQSASGAEDAKSPDFSASGWSMSSASLAMGSSPIMSPTSPRSANGLDYTSYHEQAKSPEAMSEAGAVEDDMAMGGEGEQDGGGDEAEEVDDLRDMQEVEDPRLSTLSTESSASLRTSHDKLRSLQKQNTELSRKLRDSERQLAVIGSENERLVEDLQDKLEEARSEITQRRKEEKEWKGKERLLMIQISAFEADISSLQRTVENSKQNHANMQKMYNSQCDEAQRLRDLLRDRDNEIRDFESAVQGHEADEEKYSGEITVLEAEIKRLESDLSSARTAEGYLETQKQENLQLKETIDRMRFDLDEARAAATKGTGHVRGPTGSSGPATLSRNLGDELHRRLLDAERVQEAEEEDEAERIQTTTKTETVITTRPRKSANKAGGDGSVTPKATVRIEEEIREYADVGTITDPPAIEPVIADQPEAGPSSSKGAVPDEPPAYTRVPDPLSEAEVLLRAHPRDQETGEEVDEDYESLVESLGVRCTVLEAEMKKRMGAQGKLVTGGAGTPTSTPPSSFSRRKSNRPGIINYVFYQNNNMGNVALCAGLFLMLGLTIGAQVFSPPAGMHPRDAQLFSTMNSLAMGAGVGEGFLPTSKRAWEVTRMAAGRVPT
ncbi:uncharacterized protein MKK02DRAFT_44991 [Dioszegia hungarica]|uniref:Uncharacterized protein n=1 Tax=Dioszegia hungarica TaxID=4972 RepID=A0AA38H886_9TREE|nr:uncharacterized protein MKK02DRAFT_44991 [Dioszegia hungarica]KAI9636287.1 hypothetical protein MKK02DRAFT_44991 [Dioszegia hungarica]